jgi:hypothetical protein
VVQAGLGKKQDPIYKITTATRAGSGRAPSQQVQSPELKPQVEVGFKQKRKRKKRKIPLFDE